MSSVTYSFSTGNTISASEINQNFADLVSLATAISANQILGGITSDKLASKYSVGMDTLTIVPFGAAATVTAAPAPTSAMIGGTGLGTADYYVFPATATDVMDWYPVLNTGFKGYLTSIRVYCLDRVDGTGATSPSIQFLLNNAITLGNAAIDLEVDATTYLIASDVNPIAQPLCALTDGDYIRIQIKASDDTATDTMALGVAVTFTFKYELQQ